MGQISPQDQPISNSTFNDCSVTVIYSGVIITDVLLFSDGPSAPRPLCPVPMWSCFLGLLQPLLLWCFAFFFASSSAKCTFASVAWLGDTTHSVSWRTGLSSLTWEMIAYSLRTNQSAACLNRINTYLQHDFLLLSINICLSSTLYYQMFIHAWMWVSTQVSNTFMCTVFVCKWECVHRLSELQCVFNPAGTNWWQLLLEFLWLSAPFSLLWNRETRIQPNDTPIFFFFLHSLINHVRY